MRNILNELANKYRRYRETVLLGALGLILMFPVIRLYTDNLILNVLLTLPLTWPPVHCLKLLLASRRARLYRLIFGHFLQIMSAELTGGMTFTNAFTGAIADLVLITGTRNRLMQQLCNASGMLAAHLPAAQVLDELSNQSVCREAKPILKIFSLQLRNNGNMNNLCKFATTMVNDLNDTEAQITADSNKQTVEAFIMAAMPYIMSAILQFSAGSYYAQASITTLGRVMKLASLFVAVTASALTFYIVSQGQSDVIPSSRPLFPINTCSKSKILLRIGQSLKQFLPQTILLNLQSNLAQIGMPQPPVAKPDMKSYSNHGVKLGGLPPTQQTPLNDNSNLTYVDFFCATLLPIFLIGCSITGLLLYGMNTGLWLFPFGGIGLVLLFMQQPKQKAELCRCDLINKFPFFAGLINALLNSGFVPYRALEISINLYAGETDVLGNALRKINADMRRGENYCRGLVDLAKHSYVPEIQSALNLINQYAIQGNGQALTLLAVQCNTCWQLSRNTMRKYREKSTFKILIPMMLNLISIIILTVAPVIATFSFS